MASKKVTAKVSANPSAKEIAKPAVKETAKPAAKPARTAAAALKIKQAAEQAEWRAAKATATDWAPGELVGRAVHDCGVQCTAAGSPDPAVHLDLTYEKNRMRIEIGDHATLQRLAEVFAKVLKSMRMA
jgi:hypothetical protein